MPQIPQVSLTFAIVISDYRHRHESILFVRLEKDSGWELVRLAPSKLDASCQINCYLASRTETDGTTDIFKAKQMLGGHMCLMGDVPATLFKLGTPQQVESYCQRLIDVAGKTYQLSKS